MTIPAFWSVALLLWALLADTVRCHRNIFEDSSADIPAIGTTQAPDADPWMTEKVAQEKRSRRALRRLKKSAKKNSKNSKHGHGDTWDDKNVVTTSINEKEAKSSRVNSTYRSPKQQQRSYNQHGSVSADEKHELNALEAYLNDFMAMSMPMPSPVFQVGRIHALATQYYDLLHQPNVFCTSFSFQEAASGPTRTPTASPRGEIPTRQPFVPSVPTAIPVAIVSPTQAPSEEMVTQQPTKSLIDIPLSDPPATIEPSQQSRTSGAPEFRTGVPVFVLTVVPTGQAGAVANSKAPSTISPSSVSSLLIVPTKSPALPTTDMSPAPLSMSPAIGVSPAVMDAPTESPVALPTNAPDILPVSTDSPTSTQLTPSSVPTVVPTNLPSDTPNVLSSTVPTAPIPMVCDPPITEIERQDQLLTILTDITPRSVVLTDGTAQNKAFLWLINVDKVCPQDSLNVVQRYVLAVLYYSLGGDSWNTCNSATSPTLAACSNRVRFLSADSECSWFNVTCTDGAISRIDLGTFLLAKYYAF
jgi:hypothetical protein